MWTEHLTTLNSPCSRRIAQAAFHSRNLYHIIGAPSVIPHVPRMSLSVSIETHYINDRLLHLAIRAFGYLESLDIREVQGHSMLLQLKVADICVDVEL